EAVGDGLGDVLGRGVDALVVLVVVEVGVVVLVGDLDEAGVDGVEVNEQAVGVEGGALDGCGDVPVVPVEGLADAGDGDSVGGGELGLNGDGEHGPSIAGGGARGGCPRV